MYIKATMRYTYQDNFYQKEKKSVGNGVEKTKPLCGDVNLCSHYGKQYRDSSKNRTIT